MSEREESPAEDVETVRYYTKGRRQPPYIGKDTNGSKIPGGPYTVVQPIAAATAGGLAWLTRPIWSAGMSWLVACIVGATFVGLIGWMAGKIDLSEQNPALKAWGGIRQLTADACGHIGGRPLRLTQHHPGRPIVRCAQSVEHHPLAAGPLPAEQPAAVHHTASRTAAAEPDPDADVGGHPSAGAASVPAVADVGSGPVERVSGLEALLTASRRSRV